MTDSFGGNGCGHAGRSCSDPGCDTLNPAERSCSDCYEFHMCEGCALWFCAEHIGAIDGLMFCGPCGVCAKETFGGKCGRLANHLCEECGDAICPLHDSMVGPVYALVYAAEHLRRQLPKHFCRPCLPAVAERIYKTDPDFVAQRAESERFAKSLMAKLAESIEHARMARLAKDCGIR